tara:strand:+ start:2195 stop:2764 length:570 start_codon:yes stop_codon:yes gene_type:complete
VQSPFNFIVKPEEGRRYSNTRKVGGIDLIVSTSEEDASASNRKGVVVEVPVGYTGPIKRGDTLLVHHNVFKFYNDIKGRRKSGKSFFRDDLFFVDAEQFFLYKSGGEWHAHDRYCFVKPMPMKKSLLSKPGSEEPLMGTMKYPNPYLLTQGVRIGSAVSFTPHSEYAFEIEGEKLYRIYDHQITMSDGI